MKKDVVAKLAEEAGVSIDDINYVKENAEEFKRWKAESKSPPTFPDGSEADLERRKERLREQLPETPEITYGKKIQPVRISSLPDAEIKTYLREKYRIEETDQMVCQIFKKEMPFRKLDKTHYFEKKEILSI